MRSIVDIESRFAQVTIIKRTSNLGLMKNILSGIAHVFQFYPSLIVLEDDILTSPHFLKYE